MDDNQREEIKSRRQDELEALQAFYGHQLRSTLPQPHHSGGTSSNANDDEISLNGPWFIELIDNSNVDDSNNFKIPTLELRLPPHYPLSPPSSSCAQNSSRPTPILHNVDNHNLLTSLQKQALVDELMEMYEPEMDMAIMWAERCREEFLDVDFSVMSAGGRNNRGEDDVAATENGNCEEQASLSIRFLTFNHLLFGKSHKKEAQIVSLASKVGLMGFIVYGTPGIIGLLSHNGDEEDILDFAKECSSRIGKRATVLDYEIKIDKDGGLLLSDDNAVEAEGEVNKGGKNKKSSKRKGADSNSNIGDSSTQLAKLLGADGGIATNDSVSIIANCKSGLHRFDSIAELKDVLPSGVIQTIVGL